LTTIALRPRPSDIAHDEIHDKRPVIESDACREDHDAVMTATVNSFEIGSRFGSSEMSEV
jgi:hypothetical protein